MEKIKDRTNHRIMIKTYGCAHNQADSELMATLLSEEGHKIIMFNNNKEEKKREEEQLRTADLIIINSCTVKDPSEKSFISFAKKVMQKGKPIVLAGCVPQADPNHQEIKKLMNNKKNKISIIGVEQLEEINNIVEKTINGEKITALDRREKPPALRTKTIKKNPLIEIIPVSNGCLNNCTYCKTKDSRGRLKSQPPEAIIRTIRESLNQGTKEIWLTSEDTSAYGLDLGRNENKEPINLPLLMREINKINKEFKVRIGMGNPQHFLRFIDEFIREFKSDKFYKFLHIPVQSASDKVLKSMRRGYTIKQFEKLIKRLEEEFPDINIATDYILGFPTETEEEFQKTVDFAKKHPFRTQNITQFYPRPGTPAKKLKPLPTKEVKKRAKEIMKIFQSFNPNQGTEGKTTIALFADENKESIIGHTDNYTQVIIKKDTVRKEEILGKRIKVKIKKGHKFYLEAEPVKEE